MNGVQSNGARVIGPLFEGKDWEWFCGLALSQRHCEPPSFQRVEARFKGDWGIDGFRRDHTIFQFFGDEAGNSASDRSKAQLRKLDDDIPKLQTNASDIAEMVGAGVGRYVLLVPVLQDKRVTQRAGQWTTTVLDWDLNYLADNFEIVVQHGDDLLPEWERMYRGVAGKLNLDVAEPSTEKLTEWRKGSSELIEMLDGKLDRVVPDDKTGWIDHLVREHVGQLDRMERLRNFQPIWQRVREVHQSREKTLRLRRAAPEPYQDLMALAEAYQAQLRQEITSLNADDISVLVWGAIAEWLMRCPLRYGAHG